MKRLLVSLSLITTLLVPSLVFVPALADSPTGTTTTPQGEVCQGIGLTTTNGSCGDNGAQFASVITAIINLMLVIIGVIAVIVIIISGLSFITSGGDSNKVATAKNSIIYALIGLVVVVFAEVIVHFVINTVSG